MCGVVARRGSTRFGVLAVEAWGKGGTFSSRGWVKFFFLIMFSFCTFFFFKKKRSFLFLFLGCSTTVSWATIAERFLVTFLLGRTLKNLLFFRFFFFFCFFFFPFPPKIISPKKKKKEKKKKSNTTQKEAVGRQHRPMEERGGAGVGELRHGCVIGAWSCARSMTSAGDAV